MHWNKTEINGDNILLLGQVVTDEDHELSIATNKNAKEIEKVVTELQRLMAKNGINSINVSWAGIRLIKRVEEAQMKQMVQGVETKAPN